MARIITVSRQFGSGGRELGKRLSDILEVPVYDHEIIEMLAEQHDLTPEYISSFSEKPLIQGYAGTIGRRFTVRYPAADHQLKMIRDQEQLLLDLSEKDCIIIGRAADIILRDRRPFNIFVYADMTGRIQRCMDRAGADEKLSAEQMKKKIRQIDRQRASYHGLFADTVWGDRDNYQLCVNTSGVKISSLVSPLAAYIRSWFEGQASDHG